jgi:hypothetical protein
MKRIKINGQDEVIANDFARANQMFLEVINLQSGSITIKASVSGEQMEIMKYIDDGSNAIFIAGDATMQATLPKGNYIVIAEGTDDVNDDTNIILK